jgi:hypothetical protein
MKITITETGSKLITEFSYHYEKKEMSIEYLNTAKYVYPDVEAAVVSEFIEAESKGRYINSIKANYSNEKILTEDVKD